MCYRLFMSLVVGLVTLRVVQGVLTWQQYQKSADEIIRKGDGQAEKIDGLIGFFKRKNFHTSKDKERLKELSRIREQQFRGRKRVDSKVIEKEPE